MVQYLALLHWNFFPCFESLKSTFLGALQFLWS